MNDFLSTKPRMSPHLMGNDIFNGFDITFSALSWIVVRSFPAMSPSQFSCRSHGRCYFVWMIHSIKFVIFASVLCFTALPIVGQTTKGEPFEEALRESLKQYRAGNIVESEAALNQAKAVLGKVKSVKMDHTLPTIPDGWVADDMKTEDVAPLLGGGKVVKKLYKNKSGQQQIQLEVFYGSSLIKLIRGLMENESIAKGQGYEIKKANGENVLVKKIDAKNYEMSMPMDDIIMVRLTGKESADEAMMLKMIRDLDRQKIKDLVKP